MSSFARSFPLKGSIRPLSRLMRCAAPRYRAFVSVADTHRKFGDHIDTYYSLTAVNRPMFGPLSHDLDVDVAIIGGGLAGVNCALSLSNRGIKATVLESNTIGWAASGRNGGFVHSGFALNPLSLVKKVGFDTASVMWKLSDKSLDLIRKRINTWSADPAPSAVVGQSPANGIPSGKGCNVLSGMLIGSWFNDPKGIEEEIELCNKLLGKDSFDYRTKEQISEQIGTTKYYDGYFDKNAFHFHTLNYLHNAVWEAKSKGVSFFEKSPVDSIVYQGDKKLLRLANGQTVRCNQVVICGSAYMPNLDSPSPEIRASLQTLTRSVLPVMTYACVTKPLSKELFDSVFKGSEACISDNRFACDYYRPLPATRQILWGGRVDCIGIPNEKIAGALHKDMCKIFPQLRDAEIEVAWPGVMGYAPHQMPLIGQIQVQHTGLFAGFQEKPIAKRSRSPATKASNTSQLALFPKVADSGIWYCTAFGGHGLCPTAMAGELIAEGITGKSDTWKLFNNNFGTSKLLAVGQIVGTTTAQLIYWGLQAQDYIREIKYNRR